MKKNQRLKYIKSGIMLVYSRINQYIKNGTSISTIEKIINYFLDKIVKFNYTYCGRELEVKGKYQFYNYGGMSNEP